MRMDQQLEQQTLLRRLLGLLLQCWRLLTAAFGLLIDWLNVFPRLIEIVTLVDAIRIFTYPLLRNANVFGTSPSFAALRAAALPWSRSLGIPPEHVWAYLFLGAVVVDVIGLLLMNRRPFAGYVTRLCAQLWLVSLFLFVSVAFSTTNPTGTGTPNYQNRAIVALIVFVGTAVKLGRWWAIHRQDVEKAPAYVRP